MACAFADCLRMRSPRVLLVCRAQAGDVARLQTPCSCRLRGVRGVGLRCRRRRARGQSDDAGGLQSPLSFGGFGAITRHIGRLTSAVQSAVEADALSKGQLSLINP